MLDVLGLSNRHLQHAGCRSYVFACSGPFVEGGTARIVVDLALFCCICIVEVLACIFVAQLEFMPGIEPASPEEWPLCCRSGD